MIHQRLAVTLPGADPREADHLPCYQSYVEFVNGARCCKLDYALWNILRLSVQEKPTWTVVWQQRLH